MVALMVLVEQVAAQTLVAVEAQEALAEALGGLVVVVS